LNPNLAERAATWFLENAAHPKASKESCNLARFSYAETGTVIGTASLVDLEPLAGYVGKMLIKSMVGVTGFEPATPRSRR